jgi:hypothetical protein
MSAHTPGPWCWLSIADDFHAICVGLETIADTQTIGNARLIAAAPDLLQACKRLLASSRDYTQWTERGMDTACPPSLDWAKEIEAEASAAISKATGGQ